MAALKDHFRPIAKSLSNGIIQTTKYQSNRSNFTVTIADVEGPIVNSYIVLATETSTNDGLPHTLEHLCFMGSKKYPYKGVLDVVANRCLASGTNAWTDQDHTCYTVNTVGQQGMAKILPIYLDHILRPLLTGEQYLTEVHHITGEGKDAGVVYSEMLAYEGMMEHMCEWRLKELFYPEGSGYRVETGGRLEAIRDLCSNERVRDFHRKFYRLTNVDLILVGKIDHAKILNDVIAPYETELLTDEEFGPLNSKSTPFKRPFQNLFPPMVKTVVEKIECPCDDDSSGEALFAWQGPSSKDPIGMVALEVLNDYLCDTAISPLEKLFVQRIEPYASDVDINTKEEIVLSIEIRLTGVPVEQLDNVEKMLTDQLHKISSGKEPIDMIRLIAIIKQQINKKQLEFENTASSTISKCEIGNFLYGQNEEYMINRLNQVKILRDLRKWTKADWHQFMDKYYGAANHYVGVIGVPNIDLVEQRKVENDKRIEERIKKLGDKGLKICAENLAAAVEKNSSTQPSQTLLDTCIVNNSDDVNYIPIEQYYCTRYAQVLSQQAPVAKMAKLDTSDSIINSASNRLNLESFPYPTLFQDCETDFVHISLLIDIDTMNEQERPLLLLLSEIIFESPMIVDDQKIDYQTVVQDLNENLVAYTFAPGVRNSGHTHVAELHLKAGLADYNIAVKWLKHLLYDVIIDTERVMVVAQRLVNACAELKRDSFRMATHLLNSVTYRHTSQDYLYSVVRQERYISSIIDQLTSNPEPVISRIKCVYDQLSVNRTTMVIMANSNRLKNALSEQKHQSMSDDSQLIQQPFSKHFAAVRDRQPVALDKEPPLSTSFGLHLIAPIGSCDSSYVISATKVNLEPENIDLAPVRVLLQLFSQCEGPLYNEIRGKGLAYGACILLEFDDQLLQLELFSATDPSQAYEKTRTLINDYVTGAIKFELVDIEMAKRSLINELVNRESNIIKAGNEMLLHHFRNAPNDFLRKTCAEIWSVNQSEIERVAKIYLPMMFDAKITNTAIVCNPSKLKDTVAKFKQMGMGLDEKSFDLLMMNDISDDIFIRSYNTDKM